jgi:hypothetical protein
VYAHGKVHQVRWKVCTKIEGKEKLLAPKLDNLWKHNGRRKALGTISKKIKIGEYYMNKDSVHAKSERLYCSIRKGTIANLPCCYWLKEEKIGAIFYLFSHDG